MSQDPRILNITRGFRLKRKQAERAIQECACAWVEVGVSVRDLTLAESIAARNEQAATREPMASAELPGIIVRGIQAVNIERRLAWEADQFALQTQ